MQQANELVGQIRQAMSLHFDSIANLQYAIEEEDVAISERSDELA